MEPQQPISMKIDVPSPAWSIQMHQLFETDGTLLVICKATQKDGIFPSMISKASASTMIGKK